jgi:hypothetical protein
MPVEWQGQPIGGIEATVSLDTQSIDPGIARIMAHLETLEGEFGLVAVAAARSTTAVNAGMNGVTKGINSAGYQMQILGQGLDDLQYVGEQGLRPIINNLMQFSPILGIAALAVNTLYQNMDRLTGAGSPTLTAAEEMKQLAAAIGLTADEQQRYNTLKGQEKGHAANQAGESEAEKKVMAGVGKAIDEAGLEVVKREIQAIRDAEGIEARMTEDERKQLEHAREKDARVRAAPDPLGIGDLFGAETFEQQAREAIRKRVKISDNAAIDELLDKARGDAGPEGEGAREALREMARRSPALAGLGENIETALGGGEVLGSEGKRKAKEKADAEAEKQLKKNLDEAEKANKANQKKAADREKRLVDEERKANERFLDEQDRAAFAEVDALKERNKFVEDENERKNREFFAEGDKGERDARRLREMGDKDSDLNWRLLQLMNPEAQGKSMGIAAYEASFKAKTGMSEEARALHEIAKLEREIAQNTGDMKNLKLIAVKRP